MTDEGDDDPQLRALRAVWLAMPDEDPPTRGLDALMAAARVKADEMIAVPWWRRALDVLRTPTVLALASVMVLIGGAVLISQHTDVAEVPQRARPQPKPEPPAAAPQTTVAPAGGEKESPPVAEPAPPANPHSGAAPVDLAPPPALRHHEGVKRTPKPPPGITAPAFTPTPPKAPVEAPKTKADIGEDSMGAAKQGADAPTEDQATRGPRQVLVDDLLAQSRAAADRGDCENARLIAKRIQKQDLAFYRSRVTTDAAIQKCIAAATSTLSE
jgi:hypothetical protein